MPPETPRGAMMLYHLGFHDSEGFRGFYLAFFGMEALTRQTKDVVEM